MEFIPLYYKEKISIINKMGDVGVVTMWSPVKVVQRHLEDAGIDLDRNTSRIAAIGTLFGNGLPEMLRNLLYNPQIRYLMVFGVDLGHARESLMGFFCRGLEETFCLGVTMFQVVGTNRKMDNAVLPTDFGERLVLVDLGVPSDVGSADRVVSAFAALPSLSHNPLSERRVVPIPEFKPPRFPSDPFGHNIVADSPLAAWKDVIFCLYRFGFHSKLKKGPRIELYNMKVTVRQPRIESEEELKEYGFNLNEMLEYQQSILAQEIPPGQNYSYGNRLRAYYQSGQGTHSADTLTRAVQMLRDDRNSRHVYLSLWDTARDILSGLAEGVPCLVSLYFRCVEDRLTVTAIFRTHNALDAWLKNFYGIMAVQHFVADGVGMEPGLITVLSQSISIDPQGNGLDRAKAVAEYRSEKRLKLECEQNELTEPDPNGDFVITVDEQSLKIVVEHQFQGQLLKRYLGESAEALERQLAADSAVSLISHALYLGRQLGIAEARLNRIRRMRKD